MSCLPRWRRRVSDVMRLVSQEEKVLTGAASQAVVSKESGNQDGRMPEPSVSLIPFYIWPVSPESEMSVEPTLHAVAEGCRVELRFSTEKVEIRTCLSSYI